VAVFPVPIGLSEMMGDIAEGIAAAGRILPESSRSEVGALAVRSAKVDIAFELSALARHEGGTTGLGVRTFLFGATTASGLNEQTAHNTGRITLEIVAVIEPERSAQPGPRPPRDERPKDEEPKDKEPGDERAEAERLRLALRRMREALPALDIPETDRKQVEALIGMAAAAIDAGNLYTARDIIAKLAPGFAALGPEGGRASDPAGG